MGKVRFTLAANPPILRTAILFLLVAMAPRAGLGQPSEPRSTTPPPQRSLAPIAEPRTWNDRSGKFSVNATMVGTTGKEVVLLRADGKRVAVSLGQLAEADRQHVDSIHIINGKVVGLADGDTITVVEGSTQHKIRLEGIDAPENGQAYGAQARKALAAKVFQNEVQVQWRDKDKYDRILGHVYFDGRWINGELVQEGCAWHYKEYNASPVLAAAEKEARSQRRGLWNDSRPIAPWEYRLKPSVKKPDADTSPDQGVHDDPIVYVTKTGEKFHTAGCRHLAKSAIPIPLSEAKKGYAPCGVCGASSVGR